MVWINPSDLGLIVASQRRLVRTLRLGADRDEIPCLANAASAAHRHDPNPTPLRDRHDRPPVGHPGAVVASPSRRRPAPGGGLAGSAQCYLLRAAHRLCLEVPPPRLPPHGDRLRLLQPMASGWD